MLTSWHDIQSQLLTQGVTVSERAKLVQDSRQVDTGDVFVALKGFNQDGAKFVATALVNGAACALVSSKCDPALFDANGNNVLIVNDLEQGLPAIAKQFYLPNNQTLPTVGVTGTNGKTSITHMLAQLSSLSIKRELAVIGTMGTGAINDLQPSANTTPGVTDVYRLLREFKTSEKHDFAALAMEVSSHALEQNRVKGLEFEVAVFTNLTLDHLDYHGTMDAYFDAKAKLFTDYPLANAVINLDDEYGQKLAQQLPEGVNCVAYGQSDDVKSYAQYLYIAKVECHVHGLGITVERQIEGVKDTLELQLPIYGEFNAYNLAAVLATATVLGWSVQACDFCQIKPVPGRLELFVKPSLPVAIVDYAHTPDALEQSLLAVKAHLAGDLHLIFGCGGDRDRSKRPVMATIAERYANNIIITNDNPRTESPEAIVADIQKGFLNPKAHNVIYQRKEAIRAALTSATDKDAVLIAGKGHETYQVIGTQIVDYDERVFTEEIVAELAATRASERSQGGNL